MRRLAAPEDIERVFSIYSHEKVVPFLSHDPMSMGGFKAVYAALLATSCFYVWEVDGRIAGFYKAERYPGRARHVVLLGTLAVDPEMHGAGVAHAMVTDAIERLKADGVRRIELFAESDNTRGLRFYRKLGFLHEGTLRKFYKRSSDAHYVDEFVMGLLVD
jgi:ribosomal protein S18 acetylase RimI-like enzyme